MRRLSIARSLRLALIGLTLVLAVIAALGVGSLYRARQRYDNALAATYALEASAADLLAAGVIEEVALRQARGRGAAAARRNAAATYRARVDAAGRLAADDPRSRDLIAAEVGAQARARALAATRPAARAVGAALAQARSVGVGLASRQDERRAQARNRSRADSRAALATVAIAGGLAIVAALALIASLVASMRQPLDALVGATRRLAAGELERRVDPQGPRELRDLGEAFNSMAADLADASGAIERERRRLELTIESLGDALVVCDPDGSVVSVNPRARELVPTLRPRVAAGGPESPLPDLDQALHGEVSVALSGRSLAITAARLGGEREGVVWTIRDVSERARLERLKSEFVATASHELRSPLTSIKGFVELLAHTSKLEHRQREYLDVIVRSTDRLVALVDDLLDVARIEAQQVEIEPRPTDVSELVREVATMLGPRIEEKSQQLSLAVPDGAPPALIDPTRTHQILTNLLTNAHLYTPPGGRISLHVTAERATVRVDVADSGRGMSDDELAHVYDRFYRGHHESGEPGTGLGLAIVKSLLDLQGGTIDVTSELGVGTTFTVRLPRALALDPERARAALHGARVLVIDDDQDVASLIADQLRGYGVDTETAADGAIALERLRAERFDAVTLDILMPSMGGFELLRTIRGDSDLRGLPLVVVSVLSSHAALTGELVVSKPIDAGELVETLGSALAARARVLVVGRRGLRTRIAAALEAEKVEHDWADSPEAAVERCNHQRYDVALVDAGLADSTAAIEALDLHGRRAPGPAVVVFHDDGDAPAVAGLRLESQSVVEAVAAVVARLQARAAAAAEYASAGERS